MRQCKSDTDINGVSVAFRNNKMYQFRNDRWARPGVIIDKDFNWNYNLLKPFGKNLWTAQVTKCQIIKNHYRIIYHSESHFLKTRNKFHLKNKDNERTVIQSSRNRPY